MPHVYTIDGAQALPQAVGMGAGSAPDSVPYADYEAAVQSAEKSQRRFFIASGIAVGVGLLGFVFGFISGRR
jgi:hypothetical protein